MPFPLRAVRTGHRAQVAVDVALVNCRNDGLGGVDRLALDVLDAGIQVRQIGRGVACADPRKLMAKRWTAASCSLLARRAPLMISTVSTATAATAIRIASIKPKPRYRRLAAAELSFGSAWRAPG